MLFNLWPLPSVVINGSSQRAKAASAIGKQEKKAIDHSVIAEESNKQSQLVLKLQLVVSKDCCYASFSFFSPPPFLLMSFSFFCCSKTRPKQQQFFISSLRPEELNEFNRTQQNAPVVVQFCGCGMTIYTTTTLLCLSVCLSPSFVVVVIVQLL